MKKNWLELYSLNSLTTYQGFFLFFVIIGESAGPIQTVGDKETFLNGFRASPSSGLRCYQCGQYTDGPGSITPCINYTDALHLKECPFEMSKQCIKYVNEASTVRDCAHECNEKRSDSWGTSIYCCSEDACNSATTERLSIVTNALTSTMAVWNLLRPTLSVISRIFY